MSKPDTFEPKKDKAWYVETPTEIIDFIENSVKDIVKEQFGVDINDPSVKIIDPFAGEGQFVLRGLETGIFTPEKAAEIEQIELNPDRAEICKEKTKKATGKEHVNVRCADTLSEYKGGQDTIV